MKQHPPSPTPPTKGNIRSLRNLTHYIRPYKWSLAGVGIALVITSSSVLGLGRGLAYLVDKGFNGNNPALLDNALILLLGVTVMLAIATFIRFYLITYTGERIVADIRRDIYNHIVQLSPAFFETIRSGDIMSRLTTDTTLLQTVVGSSLSVALRNTLMLIGGITLLIVTSPKLAAYVAIIIPVVVFPIVILGKKVRQYSRVSQEKVADLATHLEESIGGIKTIQAYVREPFESKTFLGHIHNSLTAALARIKLRAFLTALVIMIIFSSIGFVLWTGGHDVLAGRMTAGSLSSFIFYSVVVAGAVGALSEVVGELQRAAGAAERLFELLNIQPDITDPSNPIPLPANNTGKVHFENVVFYYPTRKEYASLNGFTLDITPGETIALVGPSGAGKSTILQLLLRFYDPQQGGIYLDGIDIRQLRIKDLRNQFGLVPQEPVIFSTTVNENIRYGNPDASDIKVREAAEAAAALEFIEKLPEGFNTHLGEKGVRLSGGQRQRIAIARAILKNPKILLLDEATSALDAQNEILVQQALENLMADRTTIVIAHRLATIQKSDRIIVMNEGKIEAIGTHQQLINQHGLYAELAKLQFAA